MKKQIQGSLYLITATIIWGVSFVAQSVGMDHIGPVTFQAIRSLLAIVGLLPIIFFMDLGKKDGKNYFTRWADKRLWIAGTLCGIPLWIASIWQQIGLVDTDAGKSAFLTAMYIVMVPIISIFLKKKPSKMVPISVGLAVIGLYCLCGVGVTGIRMSDLMLIGCALMFAVQIILIDILAPGVDGVRMNAIQALVCAVLSAVLMVFTEQPTWSGIAACWLPLAYAGILSMGVGFSLQILGQQKLPPSTASLLLSMESVFALLAGCIILKEPLGLWKGIGCVLMFAAVILCQLPEKKKA